MSKNIKIILGIILLISMFVIGYGYSIIYSSNTNVPYGEEKSLFVTSGSSYEDVLKKLEDENLLNNYSSFALVANLMKYNKEEVPSGHYLIKSGMSNRKLITKLRSGDQDPIKVVINNVRTIAELAGKVGNYFEQDSLTFIQYLSDPSVAEKYNFNAENLLTLFIPNTYEFFWTTTPEKFTQRMKKEYDAFWTQSRVEDIKKDGLSPTEAYIVASIVEKESNFDPERPAIAGVYLNRLKQGMKLQADPTVVFAIGDFNLQRVLFSHLTTNSPYNTYLNYGLPPGPICMPSVASLKSVINAEVHNYLYFCAKPDNSGQHAFAEDFSTHQRNASAFAQWLNERNIK